MDALQPWQSQPIFVTSTFQDMQAERDYLLTHVFPALEEWLATRRRHLEWVDLRVGVSAAAEDEESRELKILKVCLDEVRRSRPFLIALIGDRYGWVPQFERASAAAAEIGYRTNVAGRSVTDLEVDFGALHDPEQRRSSLIFLRAPLAYDAMPPEIAALYCDGMDTRPDATLRVARLAQLKARLREEIPQQCFDYEVAWDHETNRVTGLQSWGRMVEAQLREAFEREFGKEEASRELAWNEAEAQALQNLVDDRTRGFVGRATTLQHLEQIATAPDSEDSSWGVCISGEPGAGKTALFGELWKRVRGGAVTLVHAAGASTRGPWIGFMLRRFIAELTVHPDSLHWFRFTETGEIWNRDVLDAAQAPDATEEQLYAGFGQMLSWAAAERRVVVLIDAMDQFDEFAQAAFIAWVRTHWPPNARLVVTTTPRAPAASLAGIEGITSVPVPALDESEARGIAAAVCARYHRELPPPVMDALIARRRSDRSAWALPLWLVLATEELNLLDADDFARARHVYDGTHEERIAALMCHLVAEMPEEVQGLYRVGLSRSEESFGRELSSGFLGAIAASPSGLRETDFRVLLPALSGIAWDELQFAQLRRLFRGQLRRREPLGRWDFNHRQMRIAVRRWLTEIGIDERALHAGIADHLLALPADDPVRMSDAMLHLLDSENWARAATYLAALEDDETSRTTLTALVEQLRAPSERTREETARRLGLTLTVPGLEDVTISRVATRIVDIHYRVQGRCSLAAEQIMLTAVDTALSAITARHPENLEFLAQHARCLHFLGHLRKDAGDLAGAVSAYRQVQEIDRRLTKPGDDGVSDQRRFNASLSIGDALFSRGDFKGALACYRDLADTGSDVALGRVGVTLRLQGDYDGALAAMRKGIQILEHRVEQNPRDQRLRFHLGVAHSAIASTLADKGDLEHALQSYNVAMKLVSQTATQNPMDPHVQSEWGVMHLRIGYVLHKLFNVDAALQYVQRGSEIMRRVLDVHGENPGYRRHFALLEMEWGDLCQLQKDDEGAVVHWSAARVLAERLAAEDPTNAEWQRDFAIIVGRLALMRRTPKDVEAALAVLRNGNFGVWQQELRETRAQIEQLALTIGGAAGKTTVAPESVPRNWLARALSRLHR